MFVCPSSLDLDSNQAQRVKSEGATTACHLSSNCTSSFLAPKDNTLAPTAEDLVNNLDYLEQLGATDIYMMPTAEFGGKRDWGYTTDYFFAGADAYGFEMKRDQAVADGLLKAGEETDQESVWIGGTEAIQWLNDQMHRRGFSTMGDVVYNHTSGDANSFFANGGETPWGRKPVYAEMGPFLHRHGLVARRRRRTRISVPTAAGARSIAIGSPAAL